MSQAAPSGRLSWPWPADTSLERARRLARAYRDALARVDGPAAAALDRWAVDHGQPWIAAQEWEYDEDRLYTLAEVAEKCHVVLRTVYQWHQRGLPYVRTADGLRVRAQDLVRWEQERRQRRIRNLTP